MIDDLLLAPVRGLLRIVQEIHDHAQREFLSEENILKQLAALQIEYEMGNISRQEFEQEEAKLLERLRLARAARVLPDQEQEG
ncbi:MAG: gas vesicle protein GvpG [Bacillota bacterium]